MVDKFIKKVIKFLEILHYAKDIGTINHKKLNESKKNFNHLTSYLKRKNLINKIPYKDIHIFQITDKGIDFLINQSNLKSQKEFNKIIALTGSILALMGIHNFIVGLNLIKPLQWLTGVFLGLVIVCLIPICNFIYNTIVKD